MGTAEPELTHKNTNQMIEYIKALLKRMFLLSDMKVFIVLDCVSKSKVAKRSKVPSLQRKRFKGTLGLST